MKLLVDENFRGAIVRGLLRRRPELDLVRVPDVGLGAADDPTILAWAATEDRLVLTHDAATLIGYAYEHVAAGQAIKPDGEHVFNWRVTSVGGDPVDVLLNQGIKSIIAQI